MKRYLIGSLIGFTIAWLLFILFPKMPRKINTAIVDLPKKISSPLRFKSQSEESLSIGRAHGLNMSIASFSEANGPAEAERQWIAAGTDANRYKLLRPFLSFAPTSYSDFMVEGYSIQLPNSIDPANDRKVRLIEGEEIIY